LWDLAGSSQNLRVHWWTKPKRSGVVQVRDRVLEAVAKALSGAGVDLPFPTQVVLLHDQTEATDGDRTRQREGWPAGENPPRPRHLNEVRVEQPARDGHQRASRAEAAPNGGRAFWRRSPRES
jgi:small conductance mechanosensitive channel